MNRDLPIGAIVKLDATSRFIRSNYDIYNPTRCLGEIVSSSPYDEDWIYVRWSNGKYNSYPKDESDLIIVSAKNEDAPR